MLEQPVSRRKFLLGGGAVLAAVAVPAVLRAAPATADTAPTALPWPYDPMLDPETLAKLAYETYFVSGCAEATWWPIVYGCANSSNIANAAVTWGTIPKNMFKFGGGGVNAWGTICGTLNGSIAAIAMTGASSALEDALMEYYGDTPLPTNATDIAYRAGDWDPKADNASANEPLPNVVTSVAHSQLCHTSLSQWAMAAGFEGADTTKNAIGKPGQRDRCAKLCYDMTFKTVTMLNAYFSPNKTVPTVALDPTVTACKSCHSTNVQGKMPCESCHSVSDTHSTGG
jgi:hypothetical protein